MVAAPLKINISLHRLAGLQDPSQERDPRGRLKLCRSFHPRETSLRAEML